MLDFLAITGCDDGAIRDVKVNKNAGDPGMVSVEVIQEQTSLESGFWTGFTSDQL